jgi:NAD dependent epimerase/dehydratase family enzyme
MGEQSTIQNMKILISGASGFIATQLIPFLQTHGHQIFRIVRNTASQNLAPNDVQWNVDEGM